MITWQPGMRLDEIEEQVIRKAMRFYNGNQTTTSASLGISSKTLYNKLKSYDERDKKAEEAKRNVARPERKDLNISQFDERVKDGKGSLPN